MDTLRDIGAERHIPMVQVALAGVLGRPRVSSRLAGCQQAPFMNMDRPGRVLRKVIADHCNDNARIADKRGRATIHTLRDTYASRLVQQGMSLKKVAELLGHTTTAMTEKYANLEAINVSEEARAI